jgi:hypothetical protein
MRNGRLMPRYTGLSLGRFFLIPLAFGPGGAAPPKESKMILSKSPHQ